MLKSVEISLSGYNGSLISLVTLFRGGWLYIRERGGGCGGGGDVVARLGDLLVSMATLDLLTQHDFLGQTTLLQRQPGSVSRSLWGRGVVTYLPGVSLNHRTCLARVAMRLSSI